jgi:hypothetical protein
MIFNNICLGEQVLYRTIMGEQSLFFDRTKEIRGGKNMKQKTILKEAGALLIATIMIASVLTIFPSVKGHDYSLILDLIIGDNAGVADYDDGIYVVGTTTGNLYVIDDDGAYTITELGAGNINDVRIENDFIAVAAGKTVIELELNGLTPGELWRTTNAEWYRVVSTDLSEDGNYICYLAQRMGDMYVNAGEIGVLQGGSAGSGLISKQYTSGWRPTNWWIDATSDMEYIAVSHPTYRYSGDYYRVGVGLYRFSGMSLSFQWWTFLVAQYDVTEVRISENKDYVAAATSSGVYMDLLRLTDGTILWSYETPGKEQYACDGDINLNYVIGANQAWSPPYPWFILENKGNLGFELIAQGQMNGAINDLDSTPDGSYFTFGSDAGEVVVLERTGETINTVFTIDDLNTIDAIEIGSGTLMVGGAQFIHLYAFVLIDVYVDIKPGSCPNSINRKDSGLLPIAICGTEDFDVTTIDPTSIRITREGIPTSVTPIRWSYEDEATPFLGCDGEECCDCHNLTSDGYIDLLLKFNIQEVVNQLALDQVGGETIPLKITGNLKVEYDSIPIYGKDCLRILYSRNVGVIEILSPFSGTAQIFTPEVKVKNFGTKKEKNVPVNLVISEAGDIEYNATVYVTLDVGETIHVIFPNWLPQVWQIQENIDISYLITACMMMPYDEKPSNNCMSQVITLHFPYLHDVGVTAIISPTSGLSQTVTPEITVKNFGQFDENIIPVNMVIQRIEYGGQWTISTSNTWRQNTGYTPGIAPPCAYLPWYDATPQPWLMSQAIDTTGLGTVWLSFASYIDWYADADTYCYVESRSDASDAWTDVTPWTNPITGNVGPGTYSIDISSDIGTGTQVRFRFAGYYYDLDYWYIDDVSFGGHSTDFSGTFPPVEIILTTVFEETTPVSIASGQSLNVMFSSWTPLEIGEYLVTACTQLAGDTHTANNCITQKIILV